MWERFTESARRVVFYAQQEAGRLGENYVSTEHLLLGLVREESGAVPSVWPPPPAPLLPPIDSRGRQTDHQAACVLRVLSVPLADICSEVECHLKVGPGPNGSDMQLTPRGKRVIDFAWKEAQDNGVAFIGTEHLLLGLIRVKDGLAGRVLSSLGVDAARVRQHVRALSPADRPGSDQPPEAAQPAPTKAEPPAAPKRPWWHFLRP